ncbi:CoA-binding protein [Candidatus Pacearchaeota archaeon]|nr:CoA-binding protein [Candidatus Pacearchaeota archaeon]
MGDVSVFFDAKTYAVIGASRDRNKVGYAVFKNLLQSGKKVFPVNPKAKEILGYRSYEDLLEIPYDIDCIVIAIPAKSVPLILKQAEKRKVKAAVILSAGFSEVGNKDLEERILRIANEANIQLLGPNAYGFIDPMQKLNTTYFEGTPKQGEVAFISQSGAIGSAILDKVRKLSGFVSIGDSAQLDFSDFIEYYSNDKNTKVITLYLESLKEGKGQRFIEVCKRCKKPIIALKAGKSEEGQRAAKSHTAALASEQGVYSGILKQAGVIEVDSVKQLFNVAKVFEKYPKLGNRIAIVTNAGGLGVLTTDSCEANKIKVLKLSKQVIEKLNKILPSNWSHNNPIDLIGDALAGDYEKTLSILEKENFDFFFVLLTPQRMTEALGTAEILFKMKKPVVACFLGGRQVREAREFMDMAGILNFYDVEEMCEAVGKIVR